MNDEINRLAQVAHDAHDVPPHESMKPIVRAVLTALREPGDGLLHAYDDLSGSYTGFWASDRQEVLEGWQAMIDHLLDESA